MTGLLEDVQFAVRTLLRGGRFTVSAVLTLALVLGTNAAVFSLFYSVLLRPIEVSELDRLVLVDLPRGDQRAVGVPTRVFLDWKKESRSFAGLAGYDLSLALVGGAEGPAETRLGADVTPDFFSVVGGKVALGRTLAADEVAGKKESTVVISHALWQGRFGGDPAVVGKQLLISATKFTIVGVMAAGFAFPLQVDLWYPGTQDAGDATRAFGRLAPGVTLAAAEAELQAIHERLKRLHPRLDQQAAPRLEPLRNLDLTGARSILATVLAGSIFLLLVGCANLATQLLARSLHRRKEIATRISIGASRARIIRQLLTEAVLLALLGAGLGLLVAHWLIDLSKYLFSSLGFLPGFRAAGLSATTCGYLAAVAVAAGVLFGLAPALQLARTDIHDALKDSGRGHTGTRRARRLRDGLIVAQVALAVLVAFGAVSFGSLLERVLAKKGFDPTNVTAASLQLSPSRSESPAAELTDRLLAAVKSRPGVEAAALIDVEPYTSDLRGVTVSAGGRRHPAYRRFVAGDLGGTLRISLVRGRMLTDADRAGTAAVVSRTLAAAFFPHGDALDRRIDVGGDEQTIVGVVEDVEQTPGAGMEPIVYLPARLWPAGALTVLVRSGGQDVSADLRGLLQSLGPGVFVSRLGLLDQLIAERMIGFRLLANLTLVFGVMALLIAAVGLNGATSFWVAERRGELGLRAAIGASPAGLLRLVLGKAAVLSTLGVALGLLAVVPAARSAEKLLYSFGALSPLALGAATGAVLLVALLGSLIPAIRASRLDPVLALQR